MYGDVIFGTVLSLIGLACLCEYEYQRACKVPKKLCPLCSEVQSHCKALNTNAMERLKLHGQDQN